MSVPLIEKLTYTKTNLRVSVCEICSRISQFRHENPKHPLSQRIDEALQSLVESFRRFDRVAFSFNGGKDCMVMFYLLQTALFEITSGLHGDFSPEKLDSIQEQPFVMLVVDEGDEFPEIFEFVTVFINSFGVKNFIKLTMPVEDLYDGPVCMLPTISFKSLLNYFVEQNHIEAMYVGTRSEDKEDGFVINNITDPFNLESTFKPSDPGWPSLVRIMPILRWSTVDVWDFLIRFDVPICKLYYEGYASLGAPSRTDRHDMLHINYESDTQRISDILCRRGLEVIPIDNYDTQLEYLPAYYLPIEAKERSGRTPTISHQKPSITLET